MDVFLATLDKKIRGIKAAERELETAVGEASEELEGLKNQIRGRGSTGDPLQDWAVVQHGFDYKRYAKLAHAVQNYLANNAGQLVAKLDRSSKGIGTGEEMLSVGVLETGVLKVRSTSDGYHLAVRLSNPGSLFEKREAAFRDTGHYIVNSDISTRSPNVLILTSPKHFFDPNGLRFKRSVHYFVYSAEGNSMKGSKLIAGTPDVNNFLRSDFWKPEHTTSPSYRGLDMSKTPHGGQFYTKVPPPEARLFFDSVDISL
ncbi:MAG: hypothetical protein Q7R76_05285 [Candidatus Woesearchaeota archaeon]|nr:hypothetical protein [Candidatus Woesearchaeota archaeon]